MPSFRDPANWLILTDIETASVATGIGDVVGNKGGVGISMTIGATPIVFVNCHFAGEQMIFVLSKLTKAFPAHHDGVAQRNADYHAINAKMQLRLPVDKTDGNAAAEQHFL